jgi:hypothetical protein
MLSCDHQDPSDWEPVPLELPVAHDRSRPDLPPDADGPPEDESSGLRVIVIDLA